MKRAQQVAVAILASLTLGLGAISAHANPGAAETMGQGMRGHGASEHQAQAGAGHAGRMGRGHQAATGQHQHGGAKSGAMAGNCPMAAQHAAQSTHSH